MSKRQAAYRNSLTTAQGALRELRRRHLPYCVSPADCITCELIGDGLGEQ